MKHSLGLNETFISDASLLFQANFNLHGDSIKSKPNCLCHIYLTLDHIILTLSGYVENSTKNTIPTYRKILFNR